MQPVAWRLPLLADRNISRCGRTPLFEHLFDPLVELVDLLEQFVVPDVEFLKEAYLGGILFHEAGSFGGEQGCGGGQSLTKSVCRGPEVQPS